MNLVELYDADWNKWERDRFLKDDEKTATDSFDPEAFKHDGFEDREMYVEEFVPALADTQRLGQELTNFTPPRLKDLNYSAYQALVIRYGILSTLIRKPGYNLKKEELLTEVQDWQETIVDAHEEGDFEDDDPLLHLSKAAVSHGNDIDDSELNMIDQYLTFHNHSQEWKHQHYIWEDVFRRLSSLGRFPKVSGSASPEHAIDTIEKGLWSLQEQAIVYEIVDEDRGDVAGIPEEYTDFVADWLHYEISDENYIEMLETLDPFDRRSVLIEAADTFDIDRKNHGLNEKRRENIVAEGIYPSDVFREVLDKEDLKAIVDEYGLDAHKLKTDDMIETTIEYFEESSRHVDSGEPSVDVFLDYYVDLADGTAEDIPPQLQQLVDESDTSKKLEILFERATAEIFEKVFNLKGTELLGQGASGVVADGEIDQNGSWLLWDNKRRTGKFTLSSSTRSKIKDYITTKSQQHEVDWFLVIAPDFAQGAAQNADTIEKQVHRVNVRLVRASELEELARFWRENYADAGKEFPLSMFNGSNFLEMDTLTSALETEFS